MIHPTPSRSRRATALLGLLLIAAVVTLQSVHLHELEADASPTQKASCASCALSHAPVLAARVQVPAAVFVMEAKVMVVSVALVAAATESRSFIRPPPAF